MKFIILMSLCSPMTWLIAMMMVITWSRLARRTNRKPAPGTQISRSGSFSPEAMGAAFLFLSMAYRPNHAFVAKAQIQQQEDVDEDDEGGPDTPKRQLMRQLRKIRRGEPLETLVLRL